MSVDSGGDFGDYTAVDPELMEEMHQAAQDLPDPDQDDQDE